MKWGGLLMGAGALAGAGLGLWWFTRERTTLVFHRERADGLAAELQAFLDWWDGHGPFPVVIAADGGVRRDAGEQARLFAAGASKAKTLAETPHGRGGAVDLYPVLSFDDNGMPAAVDLHSRSKFAVIGDAAKAHGLKWGGDFSSFYDGPHVELAAWKALPFPVA